MMAKKRAFRRELVELVASRGFSSILFSAASILGARWMGAGEFGSLAGLTGLVTLGYVFADFGGVTVISRAAARGDAALVRGLIRFNLLTTLVGLVPLLVVCLALYSSIGALLVVGMVFSLALEKNSDTLLGIAIAVGNQAEGAVSLVGRRLILLVTIVVTYYASLLPPIDGYVLGMLFGGVFSQTWMRLTSGRRYVREESSVSMLEAMRVARPFLASNASAAVRNLDSTLVGTFSTVSGAGVYAAAQKLTSPFMLIPGAVTQLLLPTATIRGREFARRSARILVVVHVSLTALAVLSWPFLGRVARLFYGSGYSGIEEVLLFSLMGFAAVSLSSTLGGLLQSLGCESFVGVNGIVFALFFLVSVSGGAAIWGPKGAALSCVIVYWAKVVTLLLAIRKELGRA